MDTTVIATPDTATISTRFAAVRQRTLDLCRLLSPEDMMVQSCAEASPAKWHLAHTTWFFESFILRDFLPGYKAFHPDFFWLFNSYYQSFAAFPEKRLRASFSRPSLEEVFNYRAHVDAAVSALLEQDTTDDSLRRIQLGLNHEEQHQELLLTDTLHAFFTNPLKPAYLAEPLTAQSHLVAPLEFLLHPGGLVEVGHSGEGFCFDNEMPLHRTWLEPFQIANRLVTCEEFSEFIADGGYSRPELWLSAGWDAVRRESWTAPLYWTERDGKWSIFTLHGEIPLEQIRSVPVSHVSFFEADAYARWAQHRLPTEFEWEAAAKHQPIAGNLLDAGLLMPRSVNSSQTRQSDKHVGNYFGDCWQWTASAYLGYPGFKPLPGSLGEYNGKFMSGQMVLRGGSCVTPAAHIRATYRNFFPPETRWQFSGIRLALS